MKGNERKETTKRIGLECRQARDYSFTTNAKPRPEWPMSCVWFFNTKRGHFKDDSLQSQGSSSIEAAPCYLCHNRQHCWTMFHGTYATQHKSMSTDWIKSCLKGQNWLKKPEQAVVYHKEYSDENWGCNFFNFNSFPYLIQFLHGLCRWAKGWHFYNVLFMSEICITLQSEMVNEEKEPDGNKERETGLSILLFKLNFSEFFGGFFLFLSSLISHRTRMAIEANATK